MSPRRCDYCGRFAFRVRDVWSLRPTPSIAGEACEECAKYLGLTTPHAPDTDAQPHGANGCVLCGEHLADPHAPECPLGRAVDTLADGGTETQLHAALDLLVRAVSSGGVAYPGNRE